MATPLTSLHPISILNSRPCYNAVFSRPHLLPTPSHPSLAAHVGPFDGLFDEIRSLAANSTQRREDQPPPSAAADDGSSFVPLDPNSTGSVDGSEETTFGPLAMLAVGLLLHEFVALESLLLEMGADEVQLIPCTTTMLEGGGTLGEALQTQPPPQHDGSIDSKSSSNARVVFLSGMYASEVIEIVGAVRQCEGLADLAFAAAVPKSWGRELRELVEDVSADHAAMAARRAAAAGQTADD